MALINRKKSPSKTVKYTSRDYDVLVNDLKDFVKNYFPNAQKDFSDGSTGQMLLETMAYVGDILSFYQDEQFSELFLDDRATDENTVFASAGILGYRPKGTTCAYAKLKLQTVIPTASGDLTTFDSSSAPIIKKGSYFVADNEVNSIFNLEEDVDFSVSSSQHPITQEAYEVDASGNTTKYLVTKYGYASSGEIKTKEFLIGPATEYLDLTLDDDNVVSIESIVDSSNNKWYEVDYLAQDKIIVEKPNTLQAGGSLVDDLVDVPKVIEYIEDERRFRRFITRFDKDGNLHIKFGPGIYASEDESFATDPTLLNIPDVLFGSVISVDPATFINTRALGEAPANTTLTVKYIVSNGSEDNVLPGTITKVGYLDMDYSNIDSARSLRNINPNTTTRQAAKDSIVVTNDIPAFGGSEPESIEEIKHNARAFFAAQNRMVTKQDFESRALSMPGKYGYVAKVYAETEQQLESEIRRGVVYGKITGFELDKGNTRKELGNLSNVEIIVDNNLKFNTNEDGFFIKVLPVGNHHFSINQSGYFPSSRHINIQQDQSIQMNFSLQKKGGEITEGGKKDIA